MVSVVFTCASGWSPNKQLQRTVIRGRGHDARAALIVHVRRASCGGTRPLNCGVMRRPSFIALLASLFGLIGPASAQEFAVGQVWNYKTRSVEPGSTLTIVRIDRFQTATIIHISLADVRVKSPLAPNGISSEASHVPIAESALRDSVTTLAGTTDRLPNYQEGYKIWREAFDAGKAGYFTISVSECVDVFEKTLNQ
jgi:hypothetical protein